MQSLPIYVVDEIASVVQAVDAALFTSLGKHIQYMHGHPLEIVNLLKAKDESKSLKEKKYPLIALFQDFRENRDDYKTFGTVSLSLIIANSTESNHTAVDRYIKNFKPILYPIYNEFLKQLSNHTQFVHKPVFKHTKIDRVYWGKTGLYGVEGNIFQDHLDCIELQNLEITIKNKFCSQ